MPEIKQECESCRGTGLYQGFCEPEGVAVVCHGCGGRGWAIHKYTEFTGRKRKNKIKIIRISRGSFIATGVGGINNSDMTYDEFRRRYPE